MTTTIAVDRSKGKDFTAVTIHFEGRMYLYTGKTAEAILAAANEHAANHIIKLQQNMNDALDYDTLTTSGVREYVCNRATKLRKGEL